MTPTPFRGPRVRSSSGSAATVGPAWGLILAWIDQDMATVRGNISVRQTRVRCRCRHVPCRRRQQRGKPLHVTPRCAIPPVVPAARRCLISSSPVIAPASAPAPAPAPATQAARCLTLRPFQPWPSRLIFLFVLTPRCERTLRHKSSSGARRQVILPCKTLSRCHSGCLCRCLCLCICRSDHVFGRWGMWEGSLVH